MDKLTYIKAIEFLTTNSGVGVKIGSGYEINRDRYTEKEAIRLLNNLIRHSFIDWEFYYNYCGNNSEYINLFNTKMLQIVKDNFELYFTIDKDWSGSFIAINNDFVGFDKFRVHIDNFIKEYVPQDIFNDYKNYRLSYSGVTFN